MAKAFPKSILTASLIILVLTGVLQAGNTPSRSPDYTLLLEFIAIQDLQGPLVAFGEAENEFDRQLNQENIDFLNTNQSLLEGIQSRLESENLSWRLGASFKQLLVVPEVRNDYARLFEQYCREAIEFLLAQVHMPNPYHEITTFQDSLELPPLEESTGVTAYLVHNIANEYIEEYLFSNQADDPRQVRIKLSNREFSGTIGSYTSRLKIGEDSQFEFIRESYTLWQNSAEIPFNVFIVPIEETLHILMRPSTEAAMQAQFAQVKPTSLDQVQAIIDDWMAVEEAVVGGLVQHVMPDLMRHFIDDGAEQMLASAMAARDAHAQYHYLEKGIQVVDRLGIEATVALYRQNPDKFRQMVIDHPSPMASAVEEQSPQSVN